MADRLSLRSRPTTNQKPSTTMWAYKTFAVLLLTLMLIPVYAGRLACLPRQRLVSRLYDSTLTAPISANYKTVPLKELLDGVPNRPVSLPTPVNLKNTYYVLRHGESEANILGIISSDPTVGSSIHGLTPEGRAQARRAAVDIISTVGRENLLEVGKVVLITSPFTRARETAEEALNTISRIISFEADSYANFRTDLRLGWEIRPPVDRCILLAECDILPQVQELPSIPILTRELLRERYFGELDAKELIFYNKVWPLDQQDAFNQRHGVESVQDVCARCELLLESLERQFQDKVIILSSHADTLQIFQLFMSGKVDPRCFAEYRFRNGELRHMTSLTAKRSPLVYR